MDRESYTFTMHVTVYSKSDLRKAAWERAKADGMKWKDWQETRKCDGPQHADLMMLFDPGISPPGVTIEQSTVEYADA